MEDTFLSKLACWVFPSGGARFGRVSRALCVCSRQWWRNLSRVLSVSSRFLWVPLQDALFRRTCTTCSLGCPVQQLELWDKRTLDTVGGSVGWIQCRKRPGSSTLCPPNQGRTTLLAALLDPSGRVRCGGMLGGRCTLSVTAGSVLAW